MTYLVSHGIQGSVRAAQRSHLFHGIRGKPQLVVGITSPALSYSHSLVLTTRGATTQSLNRLVVPLKLIGRNDISSFRTINSRLHPQQHRNLSEVRIHALRNYPMEVSALEKAKKGISHRSNVSKQRVYTSMTKRFPPLPAHRFTSAVQSNGVQYCIPMSLLLRSKSMIRSPFTLLSLTQHYSDGPSRFPQVNRPGNQPSSNRWAQGVGVLGAASVLFGKTKYILAALKFTKLASLGSMALSIGAYSMLFGWPYAVGIVGLIFFHECGHLAVMLHRGIPFSPIVFIPFVGAVITTKDQPRDAWEDALIAAGGPFAGTMASCAVAVAANVTDSQILYALADFGYMINLVNLLPIGSMDGGRWAGALSKYVGVAGIGVGGYLAWAGTFVNPLFYLMLLTGAYETFRRFYDPSHLPPNFYRISNTQRAILTGGYFGLIAFLLTAMAANQRRQKPPEVIAREQGSEPYWDSSSFE